MAVPRRDALPSPTPRAAGPIGATLLWVALSCTACGSAAPRPASLPAPAEGGPAASSAASLRAPPPDAPGGSTLTGVVQPFEASAAAEGGLCVALFDPEPRALGGSATSIAATTTGTDGRFTFADLPVPATVGWVLVVDDCGDTRTWVPTGTVLPGEVVGGRGASDTIEVVAWLVPTAVRDRIDAELEASGSGSFIGEGGGMVGHSLTEAGTPHHESWVRGPNATQLWYAQAGSDWALYEKTDAAAGALWVAPDAEDVYGVWVARVAEGQFAPLMAGGLPGVLLVWDFVSWTPRTSAAL